MKLRFAVGCAAAFRGAFLRLSACLQFELHDASLAPSTGSAPWVDRPLVLGIQAKAGTSPPTSRGSSEVGAR